MLCRLRCLFPSLGVCVSTRSFPLSIKTCINSTDPQMEGGRWHIWFWKWLKWDKHMCLSALFLCSYSCCVFLSGALGEHWPLWSLCCRVAVVSRKMLWFSWFKLKRVGTVGDVWRACVCKSHIWGISDLIQHQCNLSLIRVTPQYRTRLYGRSWTHRKHSLTLFHCKLNSDKGRQSPWDIIPHTYTHSHAACNRSTVLPALSDEWYVNRCSSFIRMMLMHSWWCLLRRHPAHSRFLDRNMIMYSNWCHVTVLSS